jgi:hypothetical protein
MTADLYRAPRHPAIDVEPAGAGERPGRAAARTDMLDDYGSPALAISHAIAKWPELKSCQAEISA